MKLLTILQIFVFILTLHLFSQDYTTTTPEYEATRQTEKLQQELNLSSEQVKLVYEINLKYARARQNSTSRSEAMQRVKNKDSELEKVLRQDQINKLHTKRYERSVYQPAQSENPKTGEPVRRINPTYQRSSSSEMKTRDSEPEPTQIRRSDEFRRATQTAPTRREQSLPSNYDHGEKKAEKTTSQPPARREQISKPLQRRDTPLLTPQRSTDNPR